MTSITYVNEFKQTTGNVILLLENKTPACTKHRTIKPPKIHRGIESTSQAESLVCS